MNDNHQHHFTSAINGDMVRVFRDEKGEPHFDDKHSIVPSRVLGAEILRLSALLNIEEADGPQSTTAAG